MTHAHTILIVDDDPITRLLLKNMLQSDGYAAISEADSGETALVRLDAQVPDLILLDIQMPGLEGYDVCRIIRETHPSADIPIVMITGTELESDKALTASFEAGATDFISKPIRPLELLARVRTALSIKTARDRLKEELDLRTRAEREKERTIAELREALQTIKTLNGLLPICMSCKKIRDDGGYWSQLESYISDHSGAEFSHSICPECTADYMRKLEAAEKDTS